MFDYTQLTALIVAVYKTRKAFAEKLGVSQGCLSMKLHGSTSWSQKEIIKVAELLGIDANDIGLYFFTQKVQ